MTSTNQTKRYKGVWRKNGRWVARIHDPVTNSRVFLGQFCTQEHALKAYYDKKSEFEGFIKGESGSGLVVVDKNGFLLGEFSRLDDDLKIYE
ncbi:ethylene-responsive transcription factor ERF120-like [Bidens hawaiensis]|uniref:ethylene-responsive transcription factor ERF120-like n=1 Tax=Bidens hawaiensis TaxID=980011 RepID=UPI00404A6B31